MHRLRGKLTYSNVVSTICLVLLVGGGTAYAQSAIGKNSVGSVQIKADAIGPAELQPEAVGSSALKAGAVGTEAISDGSVTPAKLSQQLKTQLKGAKGESGAAGPQGPQGAPGAAAAAATLGIEHVQASSANDTSAEKEVQVPCPSGKVLGGGYVLTAHGASGPVLRAVRSYAVSEGSWLVRGLNSGTAEPWELTVVAVCAK
jgi:hypothetical protein